MAMNNSAENPEKANKTGGVLAEARSLLQRRIPFYFLLVFLAACCIVGYLALPDSPSATPGSNQQEDSNRSVQKPLFLKNLKLLRKNGFSFAHPVVLDYLDSESTELHALKEDLEHIIGEYKSTGVLSTASVYIEDLANDAWIEINHTEVYHPASLLKITILLGYLKKSEEEPGILERSLVLSPNSYAPGQTFEEQHIKPGVPYTVKELLFKMITLSDNYATSLLDQNLDLGIVADLFSTLEINTGDFKKTDYTMRAKDYSKFFQVLYNASFLNQKNSEQALWILTQTDFKKGLVRNTPKGITVAHKFGENSLRAVKELHESGIFYFAGKTYLITVMTKGRSAVELSDVICSISDKTLSYFTSH
jgi:hypothetical protein